MVQHKSASNVYNIKPSDRIYQREKHTVKLHKVVLARSPESSIFGLHRVDTHLDSLALTEDEDDSHRGTEGDKDDAESAKSPPEVDVGVEEIGNPGAGESRRDRRSVVETKNNRTVLQSRRVGQYNSNDIQQTKVTNPVYGVSRCVSLNILTRRFHDHANDNEKQHGKETFASTPDIDDLGDGEVGHSSKY